MNVEILEREEFPVDLKIYFPYEIRNREGKLTVMKGEYLERHLHRLALVREYFMQSLCSINDDDFQRIRKFPEYDVTPEWVIHHLLQHEAEHRGQIIQIKKWAANR